MCFASRQPFYGEILSDWNRLRILKIMLNEDRRDVEDAVPYKFGVLRKDAVPYRKKGQNGADFVY